METLTAYHEAGHVIMAACLGADVQSVTIEPDHDDGPARYGDTRARWPLGFPARELRRREIFVLLAGPVAEMIYRGEPLHPGFVPEWADDWRQAWALAEPLYRDPPARLKQLERLTRELYQMLRDDRRWAAIAALADELLAHETLDEEMIADVVAQWL
ncbi:ATP-dependent metallopeptidase FtsH/Yme1/Tma family protein [Roseimaritima ulvae]|uniref:ATP-dependent zinc metalloprotease FtsH n=2 Tax=Roseimaritima ulvae TaxID=980254 RepID=A0A5B9QZB0_9BACT|nr:hypothetical protein [Roseimaritima ulvae]QEG43220.1 ATP-dependent zinc metalloprotease FtsH [Roseimaritima ulvae]